jgi:YegS/Rv2252/BmrU family lipid kinase
MQDMELQFIVNPISGIKSKVTMVDLLKREIGRQFHYQISFTERADHATELAREAVANKKDAVVVIGGDGTINEVGKALIHTDVPLGIIPAGSGNGFARHLDIPMRAAPAIRKLHQAKLLTIDTATVNGEPFLSTVGIGFDAQVGRKFADFGRRGLLSYMQVTTNEFFKFEADEYHLFVDGEEIRTRAFLINFANVGQYGNNAWIAPTASVTDGKLNVCLLEPFPQHLVPDIIYKLFNKQIQKSKYYRGLLAEEIKVFGPGLFHLDGEPRESREELVVKVVPASLKVIC